VGEKMLGITRSRIIARPLRRGGYLFRGLALTILLASPIPARATQYIFTDLGTLGVPNNPVYGTWPHAVNDAGQVTGRGSTPQTNNMGFSWLNGTMTPLNSLGGMTSEGFGINDQGQIVGQATDSTNKAEAFIWANGQMQALPGIAQYTGGSFARAISNNGPNGVFVAGTVVTSSNLTSGALWHNGALTVIPNMAIAMGVNIAGQVVGQGGSSANSSAVLYQNGSTSTIFLGKATAINNVGQIIGYETDPDTGGQEAWPCIYDHGVLTKIGAEGSLNEPLGINDSGVVVGRYQPSYMVDHAFVWENNTFYDLNSLASAGVGGTFITAEGINDNGQITGLYTDAQGDVGGYLLTPVPEPGSLTILIFCGILLSPGRQRWRTGQ
jgi:probable HAF family extracellular repeat protein